MRDRIAIVGMSCLFPDAGGLEELWRNLLAGKISRSFASEREMRVDPRLFHHPEKGVPDRFYSLLGGYVRGFAPDLRGFGLPAEQLAGLDPLFLAVLSSCRDALRDSGHWDSPRERCGLLLGNLSFPTRSSRRLAEEIHGRVVESAVQELLGIPELELAGGPRLDEMPHDSATGIAARALRLGGPCFSFDAACSSSLYAIALGAEYLRAGKADLMLAAAVSWADPLFVSMLFSCLQAHPDDGVSLPLDRRSRGIVPAEGVGVVVLERVADARRRGDRVRATVLGAGLSNDGAGRHLLHPNAKGQLLAFERAYAAAGVPPASIDYVECHATGTPVGDGVELASLEGFFGPRGGRPFLGSVKANLGHLLTAAGMAGAVKTVLAMEAGVIPPTPGIAEPQAEQIVRAATPWPARGDSRRAGVTAFGFGGTNAHLILEGAGGEEEEKEEGRREALAPLAIVGMEGFFGQRIGPPPPGRWRGVERSPERLRELGLGPEPPPGAYLEGFEIDLLRYGVPPNEAARIAPQHLLLLRLADAALLDAGLARGGNVAVLVAMTTEPAIHRILARYNLPWMLRQGMARAGLSLPRELEDQVRESWSGAATVGQYLSYVGNVIASRVSALWDFTGPALTVSAGDGSVFHALELARLLLSSGQVEAVVVGAVELGGDLESVALRQRLAPVSGSQEPTLSFGGADGWTVGEGGGAVVLKTRDAARRAGDRIHAVVEALSLAQPVARACREAFAEAGIEPSRVGYLEASASGIAAEDEAEIEGLLEAYDGPPLSCALGSAKARVGHTFSASGMASLLQAAVALSTRQIPAVPRWKGPRDPGRWQDSPFYVPAEPAPWLTERSGESRIAAVNSLSDGSCAHLILSDEPVRGRAIAAPAAAAGPWLLPVAGTGQADLLANLAAARRDPETALRARSAAGPYVAALMGRDPEELRRQADLAVQGVAAAFAGHGEWKTPAGSYFTARPLGGRGKVAFVYPGAFNSYPGVARGLLGLFPGLSERFEAVTATPRLRLQADRLYPRSPESEMRLREDAVSMLEAGTALAFLYSTVAREYLGLRPELAFGYSLGESSMLFGLGIWGDGGAGDDSFARLRASDLFRSRLSGPKDAVREVWGLQASAEPLPWASYVVKAPPDRVEEALRGLSRVWLTHVNTPRETVIAGDPAACAEALRILGCHRVPSPLGHVLHCPPTRSAREELAALHRLPIRPVPGVTFHTAAGDGPMPLDSQAVARRIADALCERLDFPRLVRRVYDEGARIFLEVGPGHTCCRWIEETLGGREHVAVPVDRRGADERTSLLRAAARLLSHGVPVDLSWCGAAQPAAGRTLRRRIELGGPDVAEGLLGVRIGAVERLPAPPPPAPAVFGPDDLMEFAAGDIARVFGPDYAPIDASRRRIRLPLPPYLLASRVTALDAERGSLRPSFLRSEYEVPPGAWYCVDGRIPLAVALEGCQCDMMLISYLGVDLQNRGERVYRLLDWTPTFLGEMPGEGQTLRYDIRIEQFTRSGDTLLFFFGYEAWADGRPFLRMTGGCAGFFNDAELAGAKGVVDTPKEEAARRAVQRRHFSPLLRSDRSSFSTQELLQLSRGDLGACFGAAYDGNGPSPSLRLPPRALLMVDRVASVDPEGGPWGLGEIVAEKTLDPRAWYFTSHFKDDPALPGSMMAEGCAQILQLYLLYLGLHAGRSASRFQPIPGRPQPMRYRGQVPQSDGRLTYRIEVSEIGLQPEPYVVGDADIHFGGKLVTRCKGLGVRLAPSLS